MRNRLFSLFPILFALLAVQSRSHASEWNCGLKSLRSAFDPIAETSEVRTDPFDPVDRMPFGSWKGQVLDTSIKRPARLIEEDAKKIVFANFGDGEAFHQAQIPLGGIESVYFRINRFGSLGGNGVAHTLLYFKMKPGSEVILGAAKNAADFSNPTRVSEFVFSLDYTAPKGIEYEPLKSARPNYMAVMNFRSAKDYALRGEDPDHLVEYLKLNLDDEEKSKLLQTAVHRSDETKIKHAYNLVNYNCTTELFKVLDSSVKYPFWAKPFVTKLRKVNNLIAGPSENALYERGLIRQNEDGTAPAIWAEKDGFLPLGK